MRRRIGEALDGVLGRGHYTLRFHEPTFPSVRSDRRLDADAAAVLTRVLGAGHVPELRATMSLAGEDFALFLRRVPGVMFFLGVANPARGIVGMPHTSDFDLDEEALVVGTRAMSAVLWDALSR